MTTINTNIGAITAQANMNRVNEDMNAAMSRLSSGLRINAAKDDAAGMAIAEKMTSQITGLNQAVRNATDGKNLVDTTEGAHIEISNMLQRLRELAVQSSNDTNTASNRNNLSAEAKQLITEINSVSENTTFNGMKVLDGSFTNKQFQIGADAGQVLKVDVDSASSTSVGVNSLTTTSATSFSGETLTISGHSGSKDVTTAAGNSAKEVAALINGAAADTGVEASATTKAVLQGPVSSGSAVASTVSFEINGVSTNQVAIPAAGGDRLAGLRDSINAIANQTGVSAEINSAGALTLSDANGDDIKITNFASSADDSSMAIASADLAASAVLTSDADVTTGVAASSVKGTVTLSSTEAFSVATDVADVETAALAVPSTVTATPPTAAADVTFQLNGEDIAYSFDTDAATTATAMLTAVNAKTADTGVTATLSGTDVVLTDAAGGDIAITEFTTTGGSMALSAGTGASASATLDGTTTAYTADGTPAVEVAESMFNTAGGTNFASNLTSVSEIDLTSASGAESAVAIIDFALQKISQARSDLGAVSNRLDSTISNLTNITVNVEAARSGVMDADFAKESSEMARSKILAQAGTAMLAQANKSSENVLSLLR